MHTPLCGHAVGDPIEYVNAAARTGVDLITFTCHTPMPDESFGERRTRMTREDLPRYRDMASEAARHGQSVGVEVLFGIEAEVFPDEAIMQAMDDMLEPYEFDFVLGSLHHQLPSYRDRIRAMGLDDDAAIIRDYFSVLSNAVATGRYDSMAHPDLIRIYGTVAPFSPGEYEQEIRAFLSSAAAHDTCLEVNTSGWTKGVYEVHPDPVIMRWAAEAGVRFTLGSDSHKPDSVGQFFPRALSRLRDAGIHSFHYFRNRERHELAIDDALAGAPAASD